MWYNDILILLIGIAEIKRLSITEIDELMSQLNMYRQLVIVP